MGTRGGSHLRQANVDAIGQDHGQHTNTVTARGAGSEIREGLREADGVISLQHDIGNARWRYTPV